MISLPLKKMSRAEKLIALEAIWEDLSRNEEDFKSPAWHGRELAATERRIKAGKEKFFDLETVKQRLRKKSG